MSYRCLADFLEELGHAGELVRVEAEVDPMLEAAEITRRTARSDGPALLFGAVKGHDVPLLTNLLGSEERIARALGASPVDLSERIASLLQPASPEGWFERLKTAPHVTALGSVPPRRVKAGACQQVVRLGRDVNLGELPAIHSAPHEPGRAITAAVLLSAEPDFHRQCAGRYDLQVLAPDRLAVCWAAHDEPARLLAEYRRRNEQMPLAAVLGGDPTLLLAAMAPLPPGADACALAGLFREKPVEVLPCRSVDLQAPADAEIVVEGYIDPAEPPQMAGPLCTPSGRYGLPRPFPVMHVTAITHRANPIYPSMVAHEPPHEACLIERALGRIFLPLAKQAIAELVDYDLPMFAAARHCASIAIQKSYPGQARRVASAAWGLRQFLFAKVLVIVDEQVDVRDWQQVLAAIAVNVNPGRDVFFQQGPADPLDAATPAGVLGQKMAIDATAKLPEEHGAAWPAAAVMSEEIRQLVSSRWTKYGLGPPPNAA